MKQEPVAARARANVARSQEQPVPSVEFFSVFFRLPSVRSQRMFYQFAHNKCLDYSQADQRAEARVFPVVVRLPFTSRKRMFHQFSQRQLSILKTSFYLIQIFLLLHQLTPQSQRQSSCQICCDYHTGDYGNASKKCNGVFRRCELSGGVGFRNPHLSSASIVASLSIDCTIIGVQL